MTKIVDRVLGLFGQHSRKTIVVKKINEDDLSAANNLTTMLSEAYEGQKNLKASGVDAVLTCWEASSEGTGTAQIIGLTLTEELIVKEARRLFAHRYGPDYKEAQVVFA